MIRVKKVSNSELISLPEQKTEGSAGYDLQSAEPGSVTLLPGERALLATGYAWSIPKGWVGDIRPRSGLAHKFGVTVLNSPGTIDADYRGQVKVLLINHSLIPYIVEPGSRIAQMVLVPYLWPGGKSDLVEVDSIESTRRGEGGFGSTGSR